ncbi:hypothetical protein NDU88_001161 [Pleurodeles waltl]|uniref:Uncharacterized protein n=1 Tax=Pleurodeles waltl TaxID=8319 RepID=A0AAV7THJ8_PLEWA|nr:hypothetical protein NDU88_001161 [Pleurodeles waltl]
MRFPALRRSTTAGCSAVTGHLRFIRMGRFAHVLTFRCAFPPPLTLYLFRFSPGRPREAGRSKEAASVPEDAVLGGEEDDQKETVRERGREEDDREDVEYKTGGCAADDREIEESP